MSLHLTARLSEQELRRLLSEILPATVDLDPLRAESGERWIRFEVPHHVDFVPKLGLRLKTSAQVQWTALGIKVPAHLKEVELLIQPRIDEDERGPKLVFRPLIEKADFHLVPAFVDEAITTRINATLAAQGDLLGWHVGESLLQQVPLPPTVSPISAVQMGAGAVSLQVEDHCFTLHVEVRLNFARARQDTAFKETATRDAATKIRRS